MGVDVSGSKIKCCADAMLSEDRLSSVVMLDGDSVLSLLLLLCSFCVVSDTVLETSGFVTKITDDVCYCCYHACCHLCG